MLESKPTPHDQTFIHFYKKQCNILESITPMNNHYHSVHMHSIHHHHLNITRVVAAAAAVVAVLVSTG